jgi:hypothetical protein
MTMKPNHPCGRRRVGAALVAATLSFIIAGSLMTGVVNLFVHEGFPLAETAAAARTCSEYAFVSEQQACIQTLVDASYHRRVASH